jgi:DNA-binding XRE family transcriptional regulator
MMKVKPEFIESISKLARKHTPQQIADIMGEDYAFIIKVMHKNDIDVLTKKDQALYQMYKECHLYTRAEMMARLGISSTTMSNYLKDTNIEFRWEHTESPTGIKKRRPVYNKENEIRQSLAIYLITPKIIPRIKEPYTQSGSPYGIADELNQK